MSHNISQNNTYVFTKAKTSRLHKYNNRYNNTYASSTNPVRCLFALSHSLQLEIYPLRFIQQLF